MKILKSLVLFFAATLSVASVNAQGLGDVLKGLGKGGNVGDLVGSVVEGVFTKTNLTVAELAGTYTSNGPAVTFKSENLLSKAGGIAGASAIESKLKPYYEKLGLNNMTLTISEDGSFEMKVKSAPVKGTITKNESAGTFEFNFGVAGKNLAKFTAYIEKSGSTLKLMFDASKLLDLVSTISKLGNNSTLSSVGSLLGSYDGACIGFRMTGTSSNSGTTEGKGDSSSSVSSGIDALKGILKKGN